MAPSRGVVGHPRREGCGWVPLRAKLLCETWNRNGERRKKGEYVRVVPMFPPDENGEHKLYNIIAPGEGCSIAISGIWHTDLEIEGKPRK